MWMGAGEPNSTHRVTLEELRSEFPFGNLSCNSCGDDLFVYIKTNGRLLASIGTKLLNDGRLEVVEICPVVGRKGSEDLLAIARRGEIPYQLLTKSILKEAADVIY